VDSGAEENVCPWDWGYKLFGIQRADRMLNLINASGGSIEHHGKRDVKVKSVF
jgi:hypothetical protein